MQPKRAMRVAQGLYEGVSIGKGKEAELVGLITYMRTDSMRVSDDAVTEVRAMIESTYGKAFLPAEPNVFKAKNQQNVQDAHEAIRPTASILPPDVAKEYLKDEQLKLYKMIGIVRGEPDDACGVRPDQRGHRRQGRRPCLRSARERQHLARGRLA